MLAGDTAATLVDRTSRQVAWGLTTGPFGVDASWGDAETVTLDATGLAEGDYYADIVITKRIEPGLVEAGEPDEDSYPIPLTIDEALTLFEEATDIHEILGETFCMIFDEVKREEMQLFHREISPWEREHLLLNV
mgnify:CR=1 FL=1